MRELSLRTVNARTSLAVRLSMLVLLLGLGWHCALNRRGLGLFGLVLACLRRVLAGNYTACDGKSGADDHDDDGVELALSLFCVFIERVEDYAGRADNCKQPRHYDDA